MSPSRRVNPRSAAAVAAVPALLVAALSVAQTSRGLSYVFPQDRVESFVLSLRREVESEPAGAALPPSFATRIEARVERAVARVFRDGSLGLLLRMGDFAGGLVRGGDPAAEGPLDLSALDGRSIVVRSADTGELLDSAGWQHLLAAGPVAEALVEPILLLSLRLPLDVPKEGAAIPARIRLRVPVDSSLDRSIDIDAQYRQAEPPADCPRCLALHWEAKLGERSLDLRLGPAVELRGDGTGSGTVVLSAPQRRLRSHRFSTDWERTLRRMDPGADASPAAASAAPPWSLRQRVRSEGSWSAVETPK